MSLDSARSVPLPAGLKILLTAQLLFVWVVLPLRLSPVPSPLLPLLLKQVPIREQQTLLVVLVLVWSPILFVRLILL
jgi:hypothetical protein